MAMDLNLISWNVKGLNHPVKRKKVLTHLKHLKTGIAFLQETHLRRLDHARLKCGWVGQIFHTTFQAKARGVAILMDKHVTFTPSSSITDPNGRYIIVTGQLYNTKVMLANIYAPNTEDAQFFHHLFKQLPDLNSHLLIMGGDFNLCLDPALDRSSVRAGYSVSKSASCINSFLSEFGISDVWRSLHPTSKQYSFFSHVHHSYSRIDYFFADKKLTPYIATCEYSTIIISDHAPLAMKLNLPGTKANRRNWRLNSLLLSDENFVKFISEQISLFLEINMTPDVSVSTVWETLKAYVRGQIISFTAYKKKKSEAKQLEISKRIAELDKTYAHNPSPDLYKERLKLKAEYDQISSYVIENLLFRNRSNFYEHGEKAGAILARQLRGARAKQIISKVNTQNGRITTDQQEINSVFQEYYINLYTSSSPHSEDMRDFFRGLNIPSLSPNQISDLDKPISQQEIIDAIKSLQKGKSPGPDGLPGEFYTTFSVQLTPILSALYSDSLEAGVLPSTLNQACITLLAKKNKDPLNCASYRPISLLNTDYKILAKVLACRLDNVLPNIISTDQTGFIKQRRSFFNIRRLFNIMYSPCQGVSECLLCMDAEKAFDRVEWNYLFETLARFGFGKTFISWIKLLYSGPSAMVLTNNVYSKPFALHRGTRQGCPLSPLLFVLAIEPLALAIRSKSSIPGIVRGGIEHKVSLYADDLLLYMSSAETAIPSALNLLEQFGKISGYKLNLHKSEIFPLNLDMTFFENTRLPLKISSDSFKYLGITVTRNFSDLYKQNFIKLLTQTKQDLSNWSPLFLSLIGRVNTIKMSVLPKYLYIFQCLPVFISGTFFKKLDSVISSYLWNGKRPRLRKNYLQRPKNEGGLALPNFRYYYWASNLQCISYWTHHHLDNNCPTWVKLEINLCGSISLPALVGSPLPLPSTASITSPVINQTLKIYSQFRKHFNLPDMCLSSPIAFNHLFLPSMQDTSFNIWHGRGLKSFSDLFINNTFASFEQLSKKFNIPGSHFFRYLQIRHYMKESLLQFPQKPSDNIINNIMSRNPADKGTITSLLGLISKLDNSSISGILNAWEQDLQMTIVMRDWARILKTIHSSSMCARHSLLQFKVVHRAHLSKSKLAKMYPQINSTCDRCKTEEATLIHMFWLCPNLEGFWKAIFEALSIIFTVRINPDPLVSLFGVVPEGTQLPFGGKRVVAFTTLLARRLILMRWKDTAPPSISHWIRDVIVNLKLEKIRCTLHGSEKKFNETWRSFLTFFSEPSTLLQE